MTPEIRALMKMRFEFKFLEIQSKHNEPGVGPVRMPRSSGSSTAARLLSAGTLDMFFPFRLEQWYRCMLVDHSNELSRTAKRQFTNSTQDS